MRLALEMTTLILSTICVADTDGAPMSAADLAFLMDVPQREVDQSLGELVAAGSIRLDGDIYRLNRALTDFDMAKIIQLNDQTEQLRPWLDSIPVRLGS